MRNAPQLPNNQYTTETAEIYTASGFNAGDLVYYSNGDYVSASNLPAPTSASFSVNGSLGITTSYGSHASIQPVFSAAQMLSPGITGASVHKFAAVLTNGNIVQAYITSPYTTQGTQYAPYFQIVNTAGTVLYGPTLISSTYTNSSSAAINVVALTGGGFAVVWMNSTGGTANVLNYAIYSNTGTVVTAATQDTLFGYDCSNFAFEVVAQANGGFAVAVKSTGASGEIYLRAYGATGTPAFSWTDTGIQADNLNSFSYSFAIASRSDSSIFVADIYSNSQIVYRLFNGTTGASITSGSFSYNTVGGSPIGPDASVLNDGTTIVISYVASDANSSGTVLPAFRFLPSGNTLSAQTFAIPKANSLYVNAQVSNNPGNFINVLGLSAGGFVIVFSDQLGDMQYAFFNSSGTSVSPSNSSGAVPLQLNGGFLEHIIFKTSMASIPG